MARYGRVLYYRYGSWARSLAEAWTILPLLPARPRYEPIRRVGAARSQPYVLHLTASIYKCVFAAAQHHAPF